MTHGEENAALPRSIVERIGDGITHLCLSIAALALICTVLINGANVVARYVFDSAFSWAEELMLFLMILSVFTGTIAVTWRNLHIRIDTFVERVSPGLRLALQTVGSLITIGCLAVIVWESAKVVLLLRSFDQRSDALEAPAWIPQSFVTIGLAAVALILAVRLVIALAAAARSPAPEARS